MKVNEIHDLVKQIGAYYDKPYTEPQIMQWEESLAGMSGLLANAAWKRYAETSTSDRRPTLGAIVSLCDELRDGDRQFGSPAEHKVDDTPPAPPSVLRAWELFDTEYRQWCAANRVGNDVFRGLFVRMGDWVRTAIGDTERMHDNECGWLLVYEKIIEGLSRRRSELESAGQWPTHSADSMHVSV